MASSKILVGPAIETMHRLEASSVQCIVTSPPYYGLRSYGGLVAQFGGDPDCDHQWDTSEVVLRITGGLSDKQLSNPGSVTEPVGATRCGLCGMWVGELGSEPDPQDYIAHLVEVFRAARRVLHHTGLLWIVIGDSYVGSGRGPTGHNGIGNQSHRQGFVGGRGVAPSRARGLKPKDLMMIPARLAIALQEDGWYLRSDIIWAKPNPMPSSVRDRPTLSHEHILMLSKSRRYYYNQDAIREQSGANRRNVWNIIVRGTRYNHTATFPEALVEPMILAGSRPGDTVLDPFCGIGTTGLVALRHGRDFIGIDLSYESAQVANARILAMNEAKLVRSGRKVWHQLPIPTEDEHELRGADVSELS